MAAEFGAQRLGVVARELTKMHETIYRGTLQELAVRAAADENFQRGEITLVVHGATSDAPDSVDAGQLRRTVDILSKDLPPGRAAAVAAQLTGASRAAAYALATRGAASDTAARVPGEEEAP
jgi:16S rRNA (cytidine1402-2'-O)-methyltransferase